MFKTNKTKKLVSLLIVVTMLLAVAGIGAVSALGGKAGLVKTSANNVTVKIDGKNGEESYTVQPGDTITLYSYLNVTPGTEDDADTPNLDETGKISGIDATVKYDPDIFELKPEYTPRFEPNMFPIIGAAVTANLNQAGNVYFNASTASYYEFNTDDCVLVKCVFEVKEGAQGESKLEVPLLSLSAADDNGPKGTPTKLVYQGEKQKDFIKFETLEVPEHPTETESQAESQTESQAESQTESQAESQTESQTELQTESQAESQTESQAESQTESASGKATPDVSTTKSTSNTISNKTSGSAVQTGSTQIAVFFLAVLAITAGIAIFLKKRKAD